MNDPVNDVMKIFAMFGQAIDRTEAEALNKAVDDAYDKWQTEKQQNNETT